MMTSLFHIYDLENHHLAYADSEWLHELTGRSQLSLENNGVDIRFVERGSD